MQTCTRAFAAKRLTAPYPTPLPSHSVAGASRCTTSEDAYARAKRKEGNVSSAAAHPPVTATSGLMVRYAGNLGSRGGVCVCVCLCVCVCRDTWWGLHAFDHDTKTPC